MTHINTGVFIGAGVGSCSTMETKYRFRNKSEPTGDEIPKDYKQNKGAYRAQGFGCKKINNEWVWVRNERVENDNPADHYNTVLKMAKKRAHVDAVLTATAASDIFTQDIEDMDPTEDAAAQTAATMKKPEPPKPLTDDFALTAGKYGGKKFGTLSNEDLLEIFEKSKPGTVWHNQVKDYLELRNQKAEPKDVTPTDAEIEAHNRQAAEEAKATPAPADMPISNK
jgi:hypothetical protein